MDGDVDCDGEGEGRWERGEGQARCARATSDILPLPPIPSHFANYLSLTESGVALTFMPGSGREGEEEEEGEEEGKEQEGG